VTDLVQRVRRIATLLEEVEYGESEHLEGDGDVSVVVEPVQHLHTQMSAIRVPLREFLENVDFQLGCFPILFHVLDDFQSDDAILVHVLDFDYFSKRPFSEGVQDLMFEVEFLPLPLLWFSFEAVTFFCLL
jgi:hypothetical protein